MTRIALERALDAQAEDADRRVRADQRQPDRATVGMLAAHELAAQPRAIGGSASCTGRRRIERTLRTDQQNCDARREQLLETARGNGRELLGIDRAGQLRAQLVQRFGAKRLARAACSWSRKR